MRKQMVALLAGAILMMTVGSASALTIDIFNSTDTASINAWMSPSMLNITVENFEDLDAGWYESLGTGVGTFTNDGALPGIGSSSYKTKVDPSSTVAKFELRDYNQDGRFITTIPGIKYLDSADITKVNLEVIDNMRYAYFWLTDPSDVGAITTTSSASVTAALFPYLPNGSKYFVGIKSLEADINLLTISASNTGDGFGIDDFTVAAVPEPGTMMLLGIGMLGMAVYGKRRMNKNA